MAVIVRILVIMLILAVTKLNAQDFQGIATYKSKRKVAIKLDSTQINSEMQKLIQERLKKQFEKTFKLTFNKEESIYKEEESLGAPNVAGGNVQVLMINSGGGDVLYKNTKENRFANQNDVFGKIFLVKDKLNKLDWKLENETKNIGEYTCYKATMTRERRVIQRTTTTINGNKKSNEEENPEMEEIIITAWYTPQIPVNSGPGNYYGLPGLILEVNDGSETVICSKIVLNPKNKVAISEPSKGKEVTQDKFDAIMEKKMKEMQERNSGRGRGEEFHIRIGG